MPKNIVVYSDGTGQDGGVRPEQRVSNIYKMYRASRVSFDTAIDPAAQVTMYDPGLGTDIGTTALTAPGPLHSKTARFGRRAAASRRTSLSATLSSSTIINPATAFSYSASAEVRTPSAASPTCFAFAACRRKLLEDRSTLPRRKHARSPRKRYLPCWSTALDIQSKISMKNGDELARRFRSKYGSNHLEPKEPDQSNVAPYFVGVFDTVAALGASGLRRFVIQSAIYLLTALLRLRSASFLPWC